MRAFTMIDVDAAPALTDLDLPEPADGEVRVRVRAASVNGFDLAVAAGYTKDYMEHRFPLVLGKDFAGEVDAVGAVSPTTRWGTGSSAPSPSPTSATARSPSSSPCPPPSASPSCPGASPSSRALPSGWPGPRRTASSKPPPCRPGRPSSSSVPPAASATRWSSSPRQPAPGCSPPRTPTPSASWSSGSVRTSVIDHQADLAAQVRADRTGRGRRRRPPGGRPRRRASWSGTAAGSCRRCSASPEQVPTQTATVVPVFANPTPETLARSAANQANGDTAVVIQEVFSLDQVQAALDAFANGTLGKVVVTND